MPLEWLNPAEMFGGSMSETSQVECSASCIAALAAVRKRQPDLLASDIDRAISRSREWLLRQQQPDGSWPGSWGVHFTYGTMFGVRGLLAAGMPSYDLHVRRACAWLRERQRQDGGWGEHFSGCLSGSYIDHDRSQVTQTAWAMIALLEARDPDWACLERGARFLADSQLEDGKWPGQDPVGGLYESRRRQRVQLNVEAATEPLRIGA